ncbi:MAG: gliding motility-associated C-terminal domain-containing protein, partial [Bacteroidota bacterium]
WSSNLGGTIIPDNEISAQVVSADTYFLQVANSRNGCVAQDSVVVTANVAFPLADAGADQEFTCNETILILDGSGSSIGNDFVYNWTGPAGASISGATTLNPIMNEAGTYFLLVTDTTNACTALDSVQLSLNTALPELPSFGNPSFTCVDSLVTLDAMLATDSGLTPEWCQLDMSGLPIACFDTDSITVDTVGEWRFELTIDSTGCSASTIVSVGLDTLPPMVDAGPMEIFFCTLDSLALSGTAFANGADLAFSWTSDSTSLINNDTIPNPFIFRPDTFFLTVTNLMNGCVAEDSVIIQGDPNVPFIDAGADTQTNCSEASVQLMGMATTTTGLQNITWSNNGGQILSGATTLTPTVAGGGWFFLQVEEPISTCVAVDSVFVLADTIAPLIILDGPLGFQLDCTTDTLSFSSSNSNSPQGNALSFGWTGSPAGGIIPTPEDSVILIDQVGNYQLVVTDQGNTCQSMVSFEVIGDFEAPEFSIATPPDLNCLRDSVLLLTTLSDTSIQLLIQWEGEDPLGLVDPTVLSPTATRPGNYTLLLTNEQNGCSSDATVFVGIDTIAPVAAIATPDELNCTILQVALDGSLSSQGASIIYNWQAMPGEFIGPTDEVITQTAFPGVYSLQVTNQENGCFSVDSVEVLQPEVPISDVALTIIPPTCNGDQDAIIQVDSVVGGQGPYLVSFNGEPLSSQVVFSNLSAGLYPLLVEDVNGCIWEEEVEVEAPDELIVDIGPPEIEVFLGDTITLDAIVEVPFDTLFWGPASAFADPSSMQQRVLPLETAFYNVTVINENGCTATDRIVLNMTKERAVYIPNVFSPDGDGDNDVIMIFAGAEVAQIRDFQIFDRWGNRVFRSEDFLPNDPNFGWDGNFNGTAMNAAVFVYFAEVEFIDGWVEVIRGDVVLMR